METNYFSPDPQLEDILNYGVFLEDELEEIIDYDDLAEGLPLNSEYDF